jgi:hypothetical protein
LTLYRPAVAPYGPLRQPVNQDTYGTFARVLGRYALEWRVLSKEEAGKNL